MRGRNPKAMIALLLAMVLALLPTAPAEDAIPAEDIIPAEDVISVEDAASTEAAPAEEALPVEEAPADPGDAAEALALPNAEAEPQPTPVPPEADETEAVANAVPGAITLGVKEKYALNASSLAAGGPVTYKSSKSKVAAVSKKGVVTAKKKGTARIRCYAGGTLLASCKVTVLAAPKKVSLGLSKLTLGAGETWQLSPTITKNTHASFTWSSSKKSVAKVGRGGLVTARKKGKATVKVKTHNGKSAKVAVTVLAAPGKVTLDRTAADLHPGDTLKLKAALPNKTASQITWTSSDPGVAKVSGSGKVTAVGVGSATVTASTFNGKSASCAVTVSPTPTPKPVSEDGTVTYRALLIGEERFAGDYCPRNRSDVTAMADMLGSVRGLYGGRYSVTKKYDLSTSQILKAIRNTFSAADADDVSLFFIATHGDVVETGENAGTLITCPDDKLKFKDLAAALKAVPGKVIVILESCGSGAAVYANGAPQYEAAQAFDRAAVAAFAEADPGVEAAVPRGGLTSGGIRSNTGELRVENKFYVLAASDYQELSWGMENDYDHFNFFTMWLTDGIGTAGHMLADTDKNGQVTLHELYSYIAEVGDNYAIQLKRKLYYQHVQVYPANSDFVLFTR